MGEGACSWHIRYSQYVIVVQVYLVICEQTPRVFVISILRFDVEFVCNSSTETVCASIVYVVCFEIICWVRISCQFSENSGMGIRNLPIGGSEMGYML